MSGDGLNSTVPPSPTNAILPHLRVARIAVARACGIGGTVECALDAVVIRQAFYLGDIVSTGRKNDVAEVEGSR